MSIKGRRLFAALGVLGAVLGGAGSALAQGHGGGGHGGGGGHAGGGGHFSGGGGAHVGGGSRPAGGFAGGAGAHYAGGARYAGGAVSRSYGGGFHGSAYGGRGAYGYPGGAYRGYSTGAYWGGGYWRGGYWPRAYYGYGYSWFLPVLPLAYATYWYSGIPYYYANDVYYTWNPTYDGYTATDPPPVSETGTAPGADAAAVVPANDSSVAPPGAPNPAQQPLQGDMSQVFMYPKNGQSAEQQSTDKLECQKWASDQAGLGSNGPDYRRALLACVEGRGYSAK